MFSIDDAKVRRGLHRLLHGPDDLRPAMAAGVKPIADAEQAFRDLYDAFLAEMTAVCAYAVKHWEQQLKLATQETRSAAKANLAMWQQYPAGPAAEPKFIEVVRHHWLVCDGLNRERPKAGRIAPHHVLLGWLIDAVGTHHPVVQVLACMPYWPIGMDAEGGWV